ncbi:hypothetical protein [Streptomyces sp. NPDC007088]|uniref:hypothetical protein n=1 Tax=Streptomyces sp. NPDC007088 TaxID=3364773 RepID=UPI00368FACAA
MCYQSGGFRLPLEFVATLRALYRAGDSQLAPTLAAAHEAGWTYRILGSAIGLTGNRIMQIVRKNHTGTAFPVPALPPRNPRPHSKRRPAAELKPGQVEGLLVVAAEAEGDHGALRAAVHDHWARGVPRARLAEVLEIDELTVETYLAEQREVVEETFRRPPSRDEVARAEQVERQLYAQLSEATKAKAKADKIARVREGKAAKRPLPAPSLRPKRLATLATKNLRPLEGYPGEGKRWWVQCKFCDRIWHMPVERLRACPHKGTGDPGHPPLPVVKRRVETSPAPPPVAEMSITDHIGRIAYVVVVDGQWGLRVTQYPGVPQLGSHRMLLYAPLPGPSANVAEERLRDKGWTVGPDGWAKPVTLGWSVEGGMERFADAEAGSLHARVFSPLLTVYEVGRDMLGSQARKPEVTGGNFLKRHKIQSAATGHVGQRSWDLYHRAEIEAVLRMQEGK